MTKYGVFSGSYFSVFGFSLKKGKCGPEKIPYLNTFHAAQILNGSQKVIKKLDSKFTSAIWLVLCSTRVLLIAGPGVQNIFFSFN